MEFLVPFHYQFLFCVRSNKNEIEKDLERLFTNISELSLGSYLLSYLVYGLRYEFIFVCVELGFVSVKAWIFWIFGPESGSTVPFENTWHPRSFNCQP